MTGVLAIEMTALPCLAWGSCYGIAFNRNAWQTLAKENAVETDRLIDQLNELYPNTGDLFGVRNWNSPDQVKEAFSSLGIDMEGTDDTALAAIDHPLAALVRDYRSVAKLGGTYGLEWLRHVRADDRVYANWKQLGAGSSGRMSCKEPNLQQLPRDPR